MTDEQRTAADYYAVAAATIQTEAAFQSPDERSIPFLLHGLIAATLARAPGEVTLIGLRDLIDQMETRGGCRFRVSDGTVHEVRAVAVDGILGETRGVTLEGLRLMLDAVLS